MLGHRHCATWRASHIPSLTVILSARQFLWQAGSDSMGVSNNQAVFGCPVSQTGFTVGGEILGTKTYTLIGSSLLFQLAGVGATTDSSIQFTMRLQNTASGYCQFEWLSSSGSASLSAALANDQGTSLRHSRRARPPASAGVCAALRPRKDRKDADGRKLHICDDEPLTRQCTPPRPTALRNGLIQTVRCHVASSQNRRLPGGGVNVRCAIS
jgi:hypothetical protein